MLAGSVFVRCNDDLTSVGKWKASRPKFQLVPSLTFLNIENHWKSLTCSKHLVNPGCLFQKYLSCRQKMLLFTLYFLSHPHTRTRVHYSRIFIAGRNHFRPVFPFSTPMKHQKSTDFLLFLQAVEREPWPKRG